MLYKTNKVIVYSMILISVLLLFLYGNQQLYIGLSYCIYLLIILRTLNVYNRFRQRLKYLVLYTGMFICQVLFYLHIFFISQHIGYIHYSFHALNLLFLLAPLFIDYLLTLKHLNRFALPSSSEMNTVSLQHLKAVSEILRGSYNGIRNFKRTFTSKRIIEIAEDLYRHSSTAYINEGSLTDNYFNEAYKSLQDPSLYLVISNTGSAASELISYFTGKQYNHTSLSFDRDLKTIISYNGGEKVYPPGLNHEMIEFFNKKEDASFIVYKLDATPAQKELLIEKIKEINLNGSAYNVLGLLTKSSYKPNIMFCSQFVYTMLSLANLQYFEKPSTLVKPMDLIELDYHRKLSFCYELFFNENALKKESELQVDTDEIHSA